MYVIEGRRKWLYQHSDQHLLDNRNLDNRGLWRHLSSNTVGTIHRFNGHEFWATESLPFPLELSLPSLQNQQILTKKKNQKRTNVEIVVQKIIIKMPISVIIADIHLQAIN